MKHIVGVMLQRWTSAESMCEWHYLMEGLNYVFPSFLCCKRWSQLSYESPTAVAGQFHPSAAKSPCFQGKRRHAHCSASHWGWGMGWEHNRDSWEQWEVWTPGHLFLKQKQTRVILINDKPLKKLHLLKLCIHKVTLIWCEGNYCRSSLVKPREKFKLCVVSWIFIATLVINHKGACINSAEYVTNQQDGDYRCALILQIRHQILCFPSPTFGQDKDTSDCGLQCGVL